MTINLAINGYGRIGRSILRALYESSKEDFKQFNIIAINDLGSTKTNAHLTQYDSIHGKSTFLVDCEEDYLIINKNLQNKIKFLSIKDPKDLPWEQLNIDIVLECTGEFTNYEQVSMHIQAGAKKVLISAPGHNMDATIVYGVNHKILTNKHKIVSNATCTTNCLAPLILPLHQTFGIESGLMTTIHAYTNDQALIDKNHSDLRRARSAAMSIIPATTGAANTIGLIIPELAQKLDGMSFRVPTSNVSIVDLTVIAKRATSVSEVNNVLKNSANNELSEIAIINEQELVSIDFNHNPASSIFDLTQTKVIGNLIKVLAWYDNEWGFANRMLDTALIMANC